MRWATISLLLICLIIPVVGCGNDSPHYSQAEIIAIAKTQLTDTNTAFWEAEYQGDNKWLVSYQVIRRSADVKELYDEYVDLLHTRCQALKGRTMNREELDTLAEYIIQVSMVCHLAIPPSKCQSALQNIPQGQEANVIKDLILDSPTNDNIPDEVANIVGNMLIDDYYPARIYYVFYERIYTWEFSHSEPLNAE